MKITIDEIPAKIVAAKPGTVFWRVPETIAPGMHQVVFVPGPGKTPLTFALYVIGLKMSADRTNLIRGQSTQMHVVVTGLENLPATAWQSGLPPSDLVDLKRFEERSGLRVPKSSEPGTWCWSSKTNRRKRFVWASMAAVLFCSITRRISQKGRQPTRTQYSLCKAADLLSAARLQGFSNKL